MKTNKFGEPIDRNGYAPSIIEGHGPEECWLCHKNGMAEPLNRHEVFGGALRRKSMELGLWVYLCHRPCHEGPHSVHEDERLKRKLKAAAQRAAMREYNWTVEDWIREFGRSWV